MSAQWPGTRRATFEPKRRETLRPDAAPFVGQTFTWRFLWVVDEEDGGPYVGQAVWEPADRDAPWFGWVPDEDLADA